MTKKGSKYALYVKTQVDRLIAADPKFKNELTSNPQNAIEHRLKIRIPQSMLKEVLEFLREQFHLKVGSLLSDTELEHVAGGVGEIQEPKPGSTPQVQKKRPMQQANIVSVTPPKKASEPIMTKDAYTPPAVPKKMPRSSKIS